jgi:hypothetical protein
MQQEGLFIKSSQQKGQTLARGAGQTYILQKIILQQKGLFINSAQSEGQAASEGAVHILHAQQQKLGYCSLQETGLLINSALQKGQSPVEGAVHKLCTLCTTHIFLAFLNLSEVHSQYFLS